MSKTVWNVSNGDPVIADESPLESNVYHIPAGAVETAPPEFNSETHNCVYNYNTQEWDVTLKISETSDPYIHEEPEDLMEILRMIRNGYLRDSDFRILPDYQGTDVEDWKAYRQQLRDVPANNPNPTWDEDTGELVNVTWPTPPE